MFAFSFTNSAQKTSTDLISYTNDSDGNLSFELMREVDRIHEDESIVFQVFGIVEEISAVQESGKVVIPHPESLSLCEFQVSYSSHFPAGYYWYGSSLGNEDGYLSFISYNGFKRGSFSILDDVYQFEDIGEGKSIIYRMNEEDLSICGYEHFPYGGNPPPVVIGGQHCDVDVVALFTERFRKKIDGFWNSNTNKTEAIITEKIEEANTSREASQLDVEFEFVLKKIIPSNLQENVNGFMSDEHSLTFTPSSQNPGGELLLARAGASADISVIFTHGKYRDDDNNSRIGGSAGSLTLDSDLAYVVLEKKGLKNKRQRAFTLAHELFHLFGAQHFNTDLPPGVGKEYAEFIEVSPAGILLANRVSVMVNQPIPGTRVKIQLSNPDLTVEDEPFGIEGEKDNARVVSENTCTVSEFRSPPIPQLGVNIFHNDPVCQCIGTTPVEALVYNGTAPYSYDWEYSWNGGFNWVGFGNSNALVSVPVPCGGNQNSISVRVTITDNIGEVITRTSILSIFPQDNCDDDINRKFPISENSIITVSPNPYRGLIVIDLSNLNEDEKDFLIFEFFDASGKLLLTKQVMEYSNQNIYLDLSKLAQGTKILKVTTRERELSAKIIQQ